MTQIVETIPAHRSDPADASRASFSAKEGAVFNTLPGGSGGATE